MNGVRGPAAGNGRTSQKCCKKLPTLTIEVAPGNQPARVDDLGLVPTQESLRLAGGVEGRAAHAVSPQLGVAPALYIPAQRRVAQKTDSQAQSSYFVELLQPGELPAVRTQLGPLALSMLQRWELRRAGSHSRSLLICTNEDSPVRF